MIEEIIVTAQKTEQNVRDVPTSMTVMDEDFLERAGITDFRAAARHAPNVRIDNSATQPDIRIRGFGSPVFNRAFEQSVGLAIDGVPYARSAYFQGPLFDLERVEVLRGPQGTLFGKNTTAGLLNVVTKQPTDELDGFVRGELGEFEHRRFEGAVGGPVWADVVNFRVSGLSDEGDGLVDNTTAAIEPDANEAMNDRDRKAARFRLAFPDLLGAALTIGYEKVDFDTRGAGLEFREVTPAALSFYRQYDPETDVDPDNHRGSVDHPEIVRRGIDTVVANLRYGIGGWKLAAVGGYTNLSIANRADADGSPAPMIWNFGGEDGPQTTAELRLDSPALGEVLEGGPIWGLDLLAARLTSGFFFERRRIGDASTTAVLNAPVLAQFLAAQRSGGVVLPIDDETIDLLGGAGIIESFGLFDQRSTALGGFGHFTWEPLAGLSIEPGIRFSRETKRAHWQKEITDGGEPIFQEVAGQEEFIADRERSESAFTPQASLRYDVTDGINVYAKWAKGFKAGGFNAQVSNGREGFEFDAEKMSAYEIGSKMRLLNGSAAVNLALFWNDATDVQVFTVRPSDLVALVENAAKARARGVEIDAAWLATDWLTIFGGFGFNDAKSLDFKFSECPSGQSDTDGDGDERCDLSGQPLASTPKWTALVSPILRFPTRSMPGLGTLPLLSASGLDLVFGGDAEYRDVYFTDRSNDPRSRQPSFFRLSGNIGFENAEQGWVARVTAKNLTDETVAAQTRDVPMAANVLTHILEEQRLVVGSFTWKF